MGAQQILVLLVIIAAVPALAGCGARDDASGDDASTNPPSDSGPPTVIDALVQGAPARGNEVLEVQVNATGAWKILVPVVTYARSGTTWRPDILSALKAVDGEAVSRVVTTTNASALEVTGTGYARLVATHAFTGANESFLRFILAPAARVDSDTGVAAYAQSLANKAVAFRVTYAAKTATCEMTLHAGGTATPEWSAAPGEKLANCTD